MALHPEIEKLEQEVARDAADVAALVNQINVGVRAVERGVFVPDTNGWWCNPKWCEFHDTCPYVNAKRVSVSMSTKED